MGGVKRNPTVSDQVFSMLLRRIRDQEYALNERIPSETELAREFEVSRSTVRTAMAKLQMAGLIHRKHGNGTYVLMRVPQDNSVVQAVWEFTRLIKDSGRVPGVKGLATEERSPTSQEAQALGLEDESVISIERLFLADNRPLVFSRAVSPFSLLGSRELRIDATLPIDRFTAEYFDEQIAYANARISAEVAGPDAQRWLELDVCSPVLQFEEVFFSIEDRPMVYSVSQSRDKGLELKGIRPWTW
jgi:GntR family transcriptional regulator